MTPRRQKNNGQKTNDLLRRQTNAPDKYPKCKALEQAFGPRSDYQDPLKRCERLKGSKLLDCATQKRIIVVLHGNLKMLEGNQLLS